MRAAWVPPVAVLESGSRFNMPLRRVLNDYPGLTTGISIVLLLLALAIVGYYLWPRDAGPTNPPVDNEQTVDVHAAAGCPAAGDSQVVVN